VIILNQPYQRESAQDIDFEQVATNLCDGALYDAKVQLHPLLGIIELNRLDRRYTFVQGFKCALERRIAQELVTWQPEIQAVFKFDESWKESCISWNGSIHLLAKVPHLSNAMQPWGEKLDHSLLKYLKQLGWSRFRMRQRILELQQVTPEEIRYGAMFYAVYSVPVKVWAQEKKRAR
jgi:hypothetical protein